MEWNDRSSVRLHFAMALTGGFFGGYAVFGRMGVFGSAQTANLIDLVGDILGRDVPDAAARLGAFVIYVSAIVLFAVLDRKTKRDLKYLVFAVETAAVLILAALPEEVDPVVALYPVFFAASFQWCIFKGAEGYACSTIFSTNNLKQTVLSLSDWFLTDRKEQEKRRESLKKGTFFGRTLLFFHTGVGAAFLGVRVLGLKAVWLNLVFVAAALFLALRQDGRLFAGS